MKELIDVKNKFMITTDTKRMEIHVNICSNRSEHRRLTILPDKSSDCVYVSSNIPCETNRKTHGNQHY